MARSRQQCAEDRERMYDSAIRSALAEGNARKALKLATDYILSATSKRRDADPADGALLDADVAGIIRSFAAAIHSLKPARPAGCPRQPRPTDLLAVYEEALARAGGEA